MLLYTMKNRGQKLASYSHNFFSLSVALLYSASSFKIPLVYVLVCATDKFVGDLFEHIVYITKISHANLR